MKASVTGLLKGRGWRWRSVTECGVLLPVVLGLGAALSLSTPRAFGAVNVLDLTGDNNTGTINGAIFTTVNAFTQPTGTGVFDPFLTIQSPGNSATERGYNTDFNRPLPLDALRNHWNMAVLVSDLATAEINGQKYYAFQLDANEPAETDEKYLAITEIRIYTGTSGDLHPGLGQLGALGTPRWTMDTDLVNSAVKIDATRSKPGQVTSGSGSADLWVYIPASVIPADAEPYLYFYNVNSDADTDTRGDGAQGGFEEWRVLTGCDDP